MAYPCLLFVRILERIFRLMSLAYHSFMILWKKGGDKVVLALLAVHPIVDGDEVNVVQEKTVSVSLYNL